MEQQHTNLILKGAVGEGASWFQKRRASGFRTTKTEMPILGLYPSVFGTVSTVGPMSLLLWHLKRCYHIILPRLTPFPHPNLMTLHRPAAVPAAAAAAAAASLAPKILVRGCHSSFQRNIFKHPLLLQGLVHYIPQYIQPIPAHLSHLFPPLPPLPPLCYPLHAAHPGPHHRT